MNVVDVETARQASGLRLVLLTDFPSPWSEAARRIFDFKQIPYLAVRHQPNDEVLRQWTGVGNAPVAILDDKPAVSNWSEILLLSEELSKSDSLVPESYEDRVAFFGLAHLLLGPLGLCWQTRLRLIDVSLKTGGKSGFSPPVAQYLARKYGHSKQAAEEARPIMDQILSLLGLRLESSRASGNRYLFGSRMTAIDVYVAASLGVLAPLGDEVIPLPARTRNILETAAAELEWSIPRALLEHQAFIYRDHLLPNVPR